MGGLFGVPPSERSKAPGLFGGQPPRSTGAAGFSSNYMPPSFAPPIENPNPFGRRDSPSARFNAPAFGRPMSRLGRQGKPSRELRDEPPSISSSLAQLEALGGGPGGPGGRPSESAMVQSIFRNIASAEERVQNSFDPIINSGSNLGPSNANDPLGFRYLSRTGARPSDNAFLSNAQQILGSGPRAGGGGLFIEAESGLDENEVPDEQNLRLIEQEMLEAGHTRAEIRQILESAHIQRSVDRHGDNVYIEQDESSSHSSVASQSEEFGKGSQFGNLDFEMSEASIPDDKWELSDAGSVRSRQFRLSVSSLDEQRQRFSELQTVLRD